MPEQWLWLEWQLKGAALVALVWGAHWLLRQRSAAYRAWVWTLGWVALLVLPLVSTWGPKWEILAFERGGSESIPEERPAVFELWGQDTPEGFVPTRPMASEDARLMMSRPIRWGRLGALVWVCGLFAFGLRTALDGWKLHQVLRRSRAPDRALVPASSKGRVRIFPGNGSPFSLWWGRYWIFLPETATRWEPETLAAALAHERMHIQRGDPLVLWLARLAVVIHWMNPLAWRGLGLWRRSQEGACDDAVLQSGADAQTYAEALLTVARHIGGRSSTPRLGVGMAGKGDLSNRLKAILDGEGRTRPLSRRVAVWIGVFGGAATLTVGSLGSPMEDPSKGDEGMVLAPIEGPSSSVAFEDEAQMGLAFSRAYSLQGVPVLENFTQIEIEELRDGSFNTSPRTVSQLMKLGLKISDTFQLDVERQTLWVTGDGATHERVQSAITGLRQEIDASTQRPVYSRFYKVDPRRPSSPFSPPWRPIVSRVYKTDPRIFSPLVNGAFAAWYEEMEFSASETVFYNEGNGLLLVRAPEDMLERVQESLAGLEPRVPDQVVDVRCSVIAVSLDALSATGARDLFALLQGVDDPPIVSPDDRRVGRMTRSRLLRLRDLVNAEPFRAVANPVVRTMVGRQAEIQVDGIRVLVNPALYTSELEVLRGAFAVDLESEPVAEDPRDGETPFADWDAPPAPAALYSGQAWWFTMVRDEKLWITVLEQTFFDTARDQSVIAPKANDELPETTK